MANEVIITGGGRSGEVILKGLKSTPTERITGNQKNGKKLTEEDEIMKMHLFNSLCLTYRSFGNSRSYTVNQLINLTNLMPVSNKDAVEIEKEISTIFSGSYNKEQIIHIKSNASNNLKSLKRSNVKLYIKHLVAEGKIDVKDLYMVKFLEGSYIVEMLKEEYGEDFSLYNEICEEEFLKVKDKIKDIAESNGFTYAEYVQAVQKLIKIDNRVIKMINEVKVYLEVSGYDYLFIIMDITILQPESVQTVTREEARNAFENKIIKLTNKRMKKEKYYNRTQYTKEFYRLAMFVTLRKLKVEGLDEAIEEEIAQIPHKWDEMDKKYIIIKPTFEEIIAKHNNSSLSLEQVEQIEDIFEPTDEVKDTKTNEQPVVEVEVIEFVEPVRIIAQNIDRQEEFDYIYKLQMSQYKSKRAAKAAKIKSKPVSEVELRERKEVNGEIISKTKNREDYLDVLWEKWEADDANEEALEAKRKELKLWRALNSLPFGSNFNIKPAEFIIPTESFTQYEQHSEEELEIMRVEQM